MKSSHPELQVFGSFCRHHSLVVPAMAPKLLTQVIKKTSKLQGNTPHWQLWSARASSAEEACWKVGYWVDILHVAVFGKHAMIHGLVTLQCHTLINHACHMVFTPHDHLYSDTSNHTHTPT